MADRDTDTQVALLTGRVSAMQELVAHLVGKVNGAGAEAATRAMFAEVDSAILALI